MRTILFAAAVVAASTGLDIGAAQAQNYPYCLKMGPGPGNCMYSTYRRVSGECVRHRLLLSAKLRASRLLCALRPYAAGQSLLRSAILTAVSMDGERCDSIIQAALALRDANAKL